MDETCDTSASAAPARTTPRHLWVVGILAVLWNSFGAFDYTMTKSHNAAYLANFPAVIIAYIDAAPPLFTAFWALGVWSALAGSIALLLRSRFALHLFALSLLGLTVSMLYQHVLIPAPPEMNSGMMVAMTVLIWATAIALLVYARAMARRGVLR